MSSCSEVVARPGKIFLEIPLHCVAQLHKHEHIVCLDFSKKYQAPADTLIIIFLIFDLRIKSKLFFEKTVIRL